MDDVEVAVIGGGIVGLAAAWRLAQRQRDAAVFERFRIGHDRGSSHGATRIFRFAYDSPDYVRLAQQALPLWRELEAATGRDLLKITGGIDVGDPTYLENCASALKHCDARVERLTAAELKERFPWLDAGDQPAVFSPDTGVIAAQRALEAMAGHATTIKEEAPVEKLEIHDDRVTLHTANGPVRARRCIVAAGAWVEQLLKPLSIHVPTRVTREQVFYFRAPETVVPFIYRGEIARYGVPAWAGARGVKVAEHGTGERTSADGRSDEMDPEGEARVIDFVERSLPSFDPAPVAFETCLYTMTPDEDFVIDVTGPVIIASACSGHGFKFAPILGEFLARISTGEEPPAPLDRFGLSRFASTLT